MSKTNEQVVEEFITMRAGDDFLYWSHNATNTLSVSYNDKSNDLMSYNTLIARYDFDKKIIYLSDQNMTNTTSKHIRIVIDKALEHGIKVMSIPMTRGQRNFPKSEQVVGNYEARMDRYSMGTDLALAENRKEFLLNFERYKEFITVEDITPKNFVKYDTISKNLEDTEYLKALKSKRRIFLAKKDRLYEDTVNDTTLFN